MPKYCNMTMCAYDSKLLPEWCHYGTIIYYRTRLLFFTSDFKVAD